MARDDLIPAEGTIIDKQPTAQFVFIGPRVGDSKGGGTPELKRRATADLLAFLQAHGFVSQWTNRTFPAIHAA